MSPVKSNKCIHIFCRYCLQKWMKTKMECPMCKVSIDYLEKPDFSDGHFSSQLEEFVTCYREDLEN